MENLIDPEKIQKWLEAGRAWLDESVLTFSSGIQLIELIVTLIIAAVFVATVRKSVSEKLTELARKFGLHHFNRMSRAVTVPAIWVGLVWFTMFLAPELGHDTQVLRIAASLLTAWVVIRVAASFIGEPFWANALSITVWTLAALNIVGLLDPAINFLDSIALTIGETRISIYRVLKGVLVSILLVWGAIRLSKLVQNRIEKVPALTPSARALITQMFKLALIFIAGLIALETIGIDLTAVAVFTGALGIGIGFGLQRVISNLISGLILLLDRSVKPGDVITLDQTYGWVTTLGARYTSVRTRDGIEVLIPNEELIVNRVLNWSHSDKFVRLKVPLGISYNSDLERALQICVEGAGEIPRIVKSPAPNCLVMGFGDSAVDLEIRIWVADPENGRANVMSDLYRVIYRKFKEEGIEIPFPHRDVALAADRPVPVTIVKDDL